MDDGDTPAGRGRVDATDARLLQALADDPRATVVALAERLRLARNTVQARLARLEARGVLTDFAHRIDPAALGHPLRAYITTRVDQRRLDEVSAALARVPEVIEVVGLAGDDDLLVQVVAADADTLYRVAGHVLAVDGVERTSTALVMRHLVPFRLAPLLERIAGDASGRDGAHPG
jgi:DNA-binding Lrp family transcriptional regulator